jgi:two-component system, chemotaxis family, chemotaxis protein CheY
VKVLLVDDSRTMRNIQKNVLKTMGDIEATEAGDGLEALTAIAMNPGGFDLMLFDWNMPNMDGLSLVKRVRDKDRTTPIIMVTTEAEKVRIIDAIKSGVNNYVIKPFTPDVLVERIKQTLDKAKATAAA